MPKKLRIFSRYRSLIYPCKTINRSLNYAQHPPNLHK